MPLYFKTKLKGKSFPLIIRFNNFKGEAMLFYSNDEINQYPSMDNYSQLYIIDDKLKEICINIKKIDTNA